MAKVIPLRKCIGCNEMKGKDKLIRIIKDKEDNICLDTTGRMNGRGAYVCNDENCLNKVKKVKALDRAFKMTVKEEIYDALIKEYKN